jgi:hypothetical protein
VKWLLTALLFCLPTTIKAGDHWGTIPPVPEITIEHDIYSGWITLGWVSDSTFDRPIWYIVEVKQVDQDGIIDPEFLWHRPFVPIRSNFNEYISFRLQYKDSNGNIYDWIRSEMFRVRVMWGA